MNKQQIIDAAMQIATGMGVDSHNSQVIDSEMTAEDLLPLVFRHVYTVLLRDNPGRGNDLMMQNTIVVTDGQGTFPTNMLTEYRDRAYLPDFPWSSQIEYPDYNRPKFTAQLCYWAEENGIFYTTCTAEGSGSGAESSGSGSEEGESIVITGITIPSLPANATEEVEVDERDLANIIYALALAVRGELKLTI